MNDAPNPPKRNYNRPCLSRQLSKMITLILNIERFILRGIHAIQLLFTNITNSIPNTFSWSNMCSYAIRGFNNKEQVWHWQLQENTEKKFNKSSRMFSNSSIINNITEQQGKRHKNLRIYGQFKHFELVLQIKFSPC